MDGVSGHRTRVADYEGWVGIRGVCGCLPCSLCILGHLCGSLDLISTRFECLGVIMFFRKDLPQTEGRRDADHKIKTSPAGYIRPLIPQPHRLTYRSYAVVHVLQCAQT